MYSAILNESDISQHRFHLGDSIVDFNGYSFQGLKKRIMLFITHRFAVGKEASCDTVGKERLFISLMEDYSQIINRLCFSYSGNAEDMKDLRQDVLINIWNGLSHFNSESSLQTWIYRVTLNTCVSCIRQKSRRIKTDSFRSMIIDVADENENAEYFERLEELHSLLSRLNPVDRAIMTMRLDGRDNEEIAEVTGLSRSNVSTRLNRIKNKLRLQI